MKSKWLIAALVLLLAAAFTGTALGQTVVPPAHATITQYDGPQTCLTCHPTAGQEVAMSLHYQQQGSAPYLDGWEEGKLAGMMVSF